MTIPSAATATEAKFKQGGKLTLRKVSIKPGERSNVKKGAVITGTLASDILLGEPIIFRAKNKPSNRIQAEICQINGRPRTHKATKTVQEIFEKDGRDFVETKSSFYEVIAYNDFREALKLV